MRRFYSNYAHAYLGDTGLNFMSSKGESTRVSNAASDCGWFQKFMQGIHCCMGGVLLPNKTVSRYKLSVCTNVLELRWEEAQES